jgi:hypothetical protein
MMGREVIVAITYERKLDFSTWEQRYFIMENLMVVQRVLEWK